MRCATRNTKGSNGNYPVHCATQSAQVAGIRVATSCGIQGLRESDNRLRRTANQLAANRLRRTDCGEQIAPIRLRRTDNHFISTTKAAQHLARAQNLSTRTVDAVVRRLVTHCATQRPCQATSGFALHPTAECQKHNANTANCAARTSRLRRTPTRMRLRA